MPYIHFEVTEREQAAYRIVKAQRQYEGWNEMFKNECDIDVDELVDEVDAQ